MRRIPAREVRSDIGEDGFERDLGLRNPACPLALSHTQNSSAMEQVSPPLYFRVSDFMRLSAACDGDPPLQLRLSSDEMDLPIFLLTACAPMVSRHLRAISTERVESSRRRRWIDGHNDLPWAIRESRTAPRDVDAYDLRKHTAVIPISSAFAGNGHVQFGRITSPANCRL